jgi:hypothetical protein
MVLITTLGYPGARVSELVKVRLVDGDLTGARSSSRRAQGRMIASSTVRPRDAARNLGHE